MWELNGRSLSPCLTTYLLSNYVQVAIAFASLAFIFPLANSVITPPPYLLDDSKHLFSPCGSIGVPSPSFWDNMFLNNLSLWSHWLFQKDVHVQYFPLEFFLMLRKGKLYYIYLMAAERMWCKSKVVTFHIS